MVEDYLFLIPITMLYVIIGYHVGEFVFIRIPVGSLRFWVSILTIPLWPAVLSCIVIYNLWKWIER